MGTNVALVENGSKGDRLLFRYPYDTQATPNFAKRTRTSKFLTKLHNFQRKSPSFFSVVLYRATANSIPPDQC
jgi:hypothetical protein